MRSCRLGIGFVVVCLLAGVASANSFSFNGSFIQDDQLQVFLFTAPSSSVLLRTWSYAGGVNAAGATIPAGGFDPVLSLFDATGGLSASSAFIDTNNDGAGVAIDPATGNAYDSLLLLSTLSASHTYALVLSQSGNFAAGPTYGDGFIQAGQGNFTGSANGCGGTAPFCESLGIYRNGMWAVDIVGVGAASEPGSVPEPGTILSGLIGIGALALMRRRRG